MKKVHLTVFAIAMALMACQNTQTHNNNIDTVAQIKKVPAQEIIAIDIFLNPDQKMLDKAKWYNDKMRKNYPEGFSLDSTHLPHITIFQAYVKKSDINKIDSSIRNIVGDMNLASKDLNANGLYYIPYDNKGLAGITIEKNNLMDFHNRIAEMMKPYIFAKGAGSSFVPRPDGKEIMQATVDYVNSFVPNASGDKYNPHVTIGSAYENYVKKLKSEPFEKFTFKVKSVSIYKLGELGTAQIKLSTIKL